MARKKYEYHVNFIYRPNDIKFDIILSIDIVRTMGYNI